jgi:hypothetical protein
MAVRNSKAKAKQKSDGRNLQTVTMKVSRCLLAERKSENFIRSRHSLWITAGSPHWHPAIQRSLNSQNVAELWLKYGMTAVKRVTY